MINRTTLAAAVIAVALAAPAAAQYRDEDRWRGVSSVGFQAAYDRGYRDGAKEGEKDARNRRYFEFERDNKFQKADGGYKKKFGDRDSYRRAFRQGYATGYTDAYNGRSARAGNGGYRYPGSRPRAVPRGSAGSAYPGRFPGSAYPPIYGGYESSEYTDARDRGYRDGIEKGQEDGRKNRSADPLRHAWYRSADRGYDDDRGLTKDRYRDAYREGFRAGYDRAYRGRF